MEFIIFFACLFYHIAIALSIMDKQTALANLLQRCFDARLPVYQLCDLAGVSRATPSRWKLKPSSINPTTLGKLEAELDKIEAGKAA